MPKITSSSKNELLFDKGLKAIIFVFRDLKSNYYSSKEELISEIDLLKQENQNYKSKLNLLKKNLSSFSKTVYNFDFDPTEEKAPRKKK